MGRGEGGWRSGPMPGLPALPPKVWLIDLYPASGPQAGQHFHLRVRNVIPSHLSVSVSVSSYPQHTYLHVRTYARTHTDTPHMV